MVEAINDAFHVELARDPSVMVIGEDVGRAGGVFRATAGLRDRFGPNRCFDTPLAEAGILGSAVGLCMIRTRVRSLRARWASRLSMRLAGPERSDVKKTSRGLSSLTLFPPRDASCGGSSTPGISG